MSSEASLLALRRESVLALTGPEQRRIYLQLLKLAQDSRRDAGATRTAATTALRKIFGAGPYWFLRRHEDHLALPQHRRSKLIARRRRATFSAEHTYEFQYPSSRGFGRGVWRDSSGCIYNRGDAPDVLFVRLPWGSSGRARPEPRPGQTLHLQPLGADAAVTVRVAAADIRPRRATGRVFLQQPLSDPAAEAAPGGYKRLPDASAGSMRP